MSSNPTTATATEAARDFARRYVFAAAVAIALLAVAVPDATTWLATAMLVALLAGASYADLRWRRIPNALTYTATLSALGLALCGALASQPGQLALGQSVAGAAVCFGLMLLVYRFAGAGAGDVKLAAAIGATVGVADGVSAVLWCHLLAGACLPIVWLASGGASRLVAFGVGFFGVSRTSTSGVALAAAGPTPISKYQVPMAGFFALGVVLTLAGFPLL